MRKRIRKKKGIGEFTKGAIVLRWVASATIPHREQANTLAAIDHEVLEPEGAFLFPIGFGSENEWLLLLVPTRRTIEISESLADHCRQWLSSRSDVVESEVREFTVPSDAERAYRALVADFDARHPDSVA